MKSVSAVFLLQLFLITAVCGDTVDIVRVRTFDLISKDHKARVSENGFELLSVPQFRNYDLSIAQDGSISLNDVGLAGGNYAWIRKISNPFGYSVTAKLRDKGQSKSFTKIIPAGTSDFREIIPWNIDNNFFTLTIDMSGPSELPAMPIMQPGPTLQQEIEQTRERLKPVDTSRRPIRPKTYLPGKPTPEELQKRLEIMQIGEQQSLPRRGRVGTIRSTTTTEPSDAS